MSIYLMYGEETYLLEAKVKKLKKDFGELIAGINYIQIDEENAENLISDLETPAFGFPKKLIIAKNTGLFKKEKKTSSKSKANKNDNNIENKNNISEQTESSALSKKSKKSNIISEKMTLQEKVANYIENNQDELKDAVDLIFIEQEVEKNTLYQTIEKIGEVKEFALLKLPDLIANLKKICSAYQVTIDDATCKYLVECSRNEYARFNK